MKIIDDLMALAPVIPVLVIEHVADACPVAEALVAGGLPVLEVTLRTPVALDVIREMAKVEGAVVGAGTVLNDRDLEASVEAGAQFIVSPGLTDMIGKAAIASGIPFLPGIATAADIMRGLDLGLCRFKFFPAMAAGGIPMLKALAAPFHQCRFCPTGGITQDSSKCPRLVGARRSDLRRGKLARQAGQPRPRQNRNDGEGRRGSCR